MEMEIESAENDEMQEEEEEEEEEKEKDQEEERSSSTSISDGNKRPQRQAKLKAEELIRQQASSSRRNSQEKKNQKQKEKQKTTKSSSTKNKKKKKKKRIIQKKSSQNEQLLDENNPDITFSNDGVIMLGIPIGTKEFINNFVHETLAPKMKALNRLREFPTQIAYHMLRLCLAPCSVFLVRALGDSYEYFADWNQKVERAVFELADQLHDYDEFKGKEEEHWDEATIAMFEEEMQRRARRKEITCHTERNFEIARKLIGLSSREGGLESCSPLLSAKMPS